VPRQAYQYSARCDAAARLGDSREESRTSLCEAPDSRVKCGIAGDCGSIEQRRHKRRAVRMGLNAAPAIRVRKCLQGWEALGKEHGEAEGLGGVPAACVRDH
jgi:hypothetical protein